MADVNIALKDESSAIAWRDEVVKTDEEFKLAMQEAGKVLQEVKEFGDGTLVDEFYNLGTNLLNAGEKVFNAINEISTTVNTVLKKAGNFVGNVADGIKKVINIFG